MPSPYNFTFDEQEYTYHFVTKNGISYKVSFFEDNYLSAFFPENKGFSNVYQISIVRNSEKPSPADARINATVQQIVIEFFKQETSCLLSICDTADGKGIKRLNHFKRWYDSSESKDYIRMLDKISPTKDTTYYTCFFYHNQNDYRLQIEQDYNTLTEILNHKLN